jgi:hypothetical protein
VFKYMVECDFPDCGRTEESEPEANYDSAIMVPEGWLELGSYLYCPDHFPSDLGMQYGPWTLERFEKAQRNFAKNSIFGQIYSAQIEKQLRDLTIFPKVVKQTQPNRDFISFPIRRDSDSNQ